MYGNVWKCIACKIGRNTTPIGSHGNSFQEAHGGLIQYRSLSLWRPFLESSVFGGRRLTRWLYIENKMRFLIYPD